jgi:hypothetical protein
VRKDDERNPRPVRGSDDEGSQNSAARESRFAFSELVNRFKVEILFSGEDLEKLCLIVAVYDKVRDHVNTCVSILNGAYENFKPHEKRNMNLTKGILPGSNEGVSSEDLGKANEIQKRLELLERCFASDSDAARSAEFDAELSAKLVRLKKEYPNHVIEVIRFYSKLANLEGESPKEAWLKGFDATKKLVDAFKSIDRALERIGKISRWWDENEKLGNFEGDSEGKDRLVNRIKPIALKLFKQVDDAYMQIADISDSFWIYLPSELQEIIESMARHVFLKNVHSDLNACFERHWVISDFPTSIFASAERGKSRPKLRVLDLNSFGGRGNCEKHQDW